MSCFLPKIRGDYHGLLPSAIVYSEMRRKKLDAFTDPIRVENLVRAIAIDFFNNTMNARKYEQVRDTLLNMSFTFNEIRPLPDEIKTIKDIRVNKLYVQYPEKSPEHSKFLYKLLNLFR